MGHRYSLPYLSTNPHIFNKSTFDCLLSSLRVLILNYKNSLRTRTDCALLSLSLTVSGHRRMYWHTSRTWSDCMGVSLGLNCPHMLHTMGKFNRRIHKWYISYFSEKKGCVISCKLSYQETTCLNCQSLISQKNKIISKYRFYWFFPRLLSVKAIFVMVANVVIFYLRFYTVLPGRHDIGECFPYYGIVKSAQIAS